MKIDQRSDHQRPMIVLNFSNKTRDNLFFLGNKNRFQLLLFLCLVFSDTLGRENKSCHPEMAVNQVNFYVTIMAVC